MKTLDTIYRAFTDYRKTSYDDRECALQRSLVSRTDINNDVIETIRHTLIIEEDWVKAIEEGLVFVEKAIAEERQFIRNYGEVVPIEKVRRVSRDSVEHLSKHTDLITTAPEEGEPLIPDELYTVERLSDYAVYENRFLYMLLCYLEQFISIRYDKIVDLANTYRGSLKISKELTSNRQNLTFKVELKEERRNDPLLSELNPNKSIIERIDMLGKQVAHFKNTPLMQEVKKAPMLHPPITVTNVLRMNHNFRGAMKLYEFVSSYDKPGYSSKREDKRISPFAENVADEFAEVEALASFLAYEYGMGVKEILKGQYMRDEEEKKRLAEQKVLEQLKALRKRIAEGGGDPEQYMLMLEKRNRSLESDSLQLSEARKEIEKLNEEIEGLTKTIAALEERDEGRLAEIEALKQEHAAEIERVNAECERSIEEIRTERDNRAQELKAQYDAELGAIDSRYAAEMENLNTLHRERLDAINAQHAAELESKATQVAELNAVIEEQAGEHEKKLREVRESCTATVADCVRRTEAAEAKLADVMNENKLLGDLKTVADARLNALRYKHGYIDSAEQEALTEESSFNEIEHQYAVFGEFFKKTWKRTKKKIRSNVKAAMAAQEQQAQKPKQEAQETQEMPPQESPAETDGTTDQDGE